MKQYDYIIIGAGCAGLSLLMRLLDNDPGQERKILLADRSAKNTNDRTWCFWEKEDGYFENIVYKKWKDLYFSCDDVELKLNMGDYAYKMIRGIDFYNYCFNRIRQHKNIDVEIADVLSVEATDGLCIIKTSSGIIEAGASFVFNSIPPALPANKKHIHLLQHFKGWMINTAGVLPNIKPRLMDFRTDQTPGTAFVYTLPVDESRALIEYTVFSDSLLPNNDYDNALREYVKTILKADNYTIEHTEFGVIPMTNYKYPFYKDGIYYIGSAGGQTKPSSGYTFSFIQKQSGEIASALLTSPAVLKNNNTLFRFKLYDSILLKVLHDNILPGKEIFKRLFNSLPAHQIFKFLDNETGLTEELKVLNAMPAKIFFPVAVKQILQAVGS